MRILMTAGPTREYIDDVRFLSNASSGRMGYSLATPRMPSVPNNFFTIYTKNPLNLSGYKKIRFRLIHNALQPLDADIFFFQSQARDGL